MKRVLVTGASGFLGRHCLPLLQARGFEVHATSLSGMGVQSPKGAHWYQLDLLHGNQRLELIATVKPTHLLHLAWYTNPGLYWSSLENSRWVHSSVELVQEFARHGGQRLLIAGSCAEYDWRYGFCSERTTPLTPSSVYGVCKHALQMMVQAHAECTMLNWAWARIFWVYGPHEPREKLVSSLIRSLVEGEKARCSEGSQLRDFLYVEDVADALVALLETDVQGPVNVASGKPVAVRTIHEMLGNLIERPDLLGSGDMPAAEGEDVPLVVGDTRRLSNEVGWEPTVTLTDGLAATLHWWKCANVMAQKVGGT